MSPRLRSNASLRYRSRRPGLEVAWPIAGLNILFVRKQGWWREGFSDPVRAEQFGLHENGLHGFLLQVRRVAVFVQDAFHHDLDLGSGAFAERPVDGYALADFGDQFGGDDFQFVVRNVARAVPLLFRTSSKISLPGQNVRQNVRQPAS